MKKVFKIVFALLLSVIFIDTTNVYAETPTLDKIAETFNKSSMVERYAEAGQTLKATSGENKISVTIVSDSTKSDETGPAIALYEYNLNGTILSGEVLMSDSGEGMMSYIIWIMLVDSVGQLHGYDDGELFTTLNSDDIVNYSLEKEGYEIKEKRENVYEAKVDISKKIPLMDMSDTYIEVSDLEDMEKFISGDGSAELNKGNVWFNKSGHDGDYTVLVAEKGNLTSNAYNSILSILTVMFGSSAAADYFEANYPNIGSETKEFKGIKIEVNPTKTEFESKLIADDSGFKFMRIKIDKDVYAANMYNKSNDSKEIITNVPDTAKSIGFRFLIYGCFLIIMGAVTVFYVLTKRTIKQEQ